MVSSNKILTVSYGTFSCTLEGFDNSFDTMKAIAEYFRDLAQDDRYFGAEPPTPDAEMLARIAEREIERRVEARFEKGNLVLRPSDDAEPPQGDVAPKSSTGAALVGATAGVAATSAAVANTQDDSAEAVTEDDLSALDVAELVSRSDTGVETPALGFAQDESDLANAAQLDIEDSDDIAIDLSDLDLSDTAVVSDAADEVVTDADDILDAADEFDDASSIDDLILEQQAKSDEAEPEPVAKDAPVLTDSVADKLQRIRAVVASKAQAAPDYIEDEHAMSGPDGDGNEENDAIDATSEIPGFVASDADFVEDADEDESADDNLFTDTIAAIVHDEIDADDEDDDDEALLSDLSFDDDDEDDGDDLAALEDEDEDEDDHAFAAETDADISDTHREIEALRAKIAELEAQTKATPLELVGSDTDLTADDAQDDEDDDVAQSDMDLSEPVDAVAEDDIDEDDTPEPLIARVSKAKRADIEAAMAAGELEEYEDDEDDFAQQQAPAETARLPGHDGSSLTPEQEAELARELADLNAEIEEDEDWNFDDDDVDEDNSAPALSAEDEEVAEANIRKAVKLTSPGRAMLTDTSIEEDQDSVVRLADKAETEMDEPEGNRRRSAIAHLRAAVAATKADRILGFGKKDVNEEEPYREDLADAVRPRRPKVTEIRSARPAPVRPAPLKLVAEQRIDVDGEADTKPVRPRRVMRSVEAVDTQDDLMADDTGFAEFAESQGAHTLSELLEAAAAYMSFVEGRDQFSRPQLMTKLLQAEAEASSREERLRSFGQLLRDGKIEKKGGGRFAASENIGFKPDARAMG